MQELRKRGLSIKEACEAAGISRSSYYASNRVYCKQKQEQMNLEEAMVVEKIKQIKGKFPFSGYRRSWGMATQTSWFKGQQEKGAKVDEGPWPSR